MTANNSINNTATGMTLVTPALGTPASGNLTNCTNIPVAQATGTLLIAHGGTGSTSFNAFLPIVTGSGGTTISQPTGTSSYQGQTFIIGGGITPGNPTSVVSLGTIPGKNRLVNGDMQIWQRDVGGTASFAVPASTTQYVADNWQISTGANQAFTVSQQGGATSGSFLMQVQRNSGQTGTGVVRVCNTLAIDQCIGAAGYDITVSYKALKGGNYSATSSALALNLYGGTGSTNKSGINGAFTGSSTLINTSDTLTGSIANYAHSKGTAVASTVTQLCLEFQFTPVGTAGVNDWFQITDVMVEVSPNQTPFERLDFEQQLHRCQRTYWKTFPYATKPAQNSGTLNGAIQYLSQIASTTAGYSDMVYFPTNMLSAPTPTYYSPSSASANWYNVTASADSGAASTPNSSVGNFVVKNPQVVGDLAGAQFAVHATCDVGLV